MEQAITIWVDESTEVKVNGQNYNLVGYLITNSDKEEFDFLNLLKQARKGISSCWVTLHGSEIRETDTRELALLDRWIKLFKEADGVYFHAFLYRRNDMYIPQGETYEHYFAKQSVFSLAHKMKDRGHLVNTMFKDISTLSVLFERRRAHTIHTTTDSGGRTTANRLNNLEGVYRDQICKQISKISGKKAGTDQLTVRFSFLSAECFDAMQFSDCLTYLVRKKIEQEQEKDENAFTQLFNKHFLDDLDQHTRDTGFKKIYAYSKKFNFFESGA